MSIALYSVWKMFWTSLQSFSFFSPACWCVWLQALENLPANTYPSAFLTRDRGPFIAPFGFSGLGAQDTVIQNKLSLPARNIVFHLHTAQTGNHLLSSCSCLIAGQSVPRRQREQTSQRQRSLTWARFSMPPRLCRVSCRNGNHRTWVSDEGRGVLHITHHFLTEIHNCWFNVHNLT